MFNCFRLPWIEQDICVPWKVTCSQAYPPIRLRTSWPGLIDFEYHCSLTVDKSYRPLLMVTNKSFCVVCLFVCLGIFVLLENYSIIWRHNHYRWRAANVDLYSALMAIQMWGVFNVQHLYCYTGHPLIMVISKDLWHSYLLPIFYSGAVITCFNDFSLS